MIPQEQALADLDKEILEKQELLNIAQTDQYRLKKELIERSEDVRKAKYNLSRLNVQRKIAERIFWNARREGSV